MKKVGTKHFVLYRPKRNYMGWVEGHLIEGCFATEVGLMTKAKPGDIVHEVETVRVLDVVTARLVPRG